MNAGREGQPESLFDSAKEVPDVPRDLYRRLQFVARVLREAPARAASGPAIFWFDETGLKFFELKGVELHGGRHPSNDIILPSPRVSRRHIRIRRVGSAIELEDLRSSNGTMVNGSRVRSARALQEGDVINVAGTALVFVWRQE